MLPGVIGAIQANEVLKILVGYGEPLVGRLLTFDAQDTRFGELKVKRDTDCPTCGVSATGDGRSLSALPVVERVSSPAD